MERLVILLAAGLALAGCAAQQYGSPLATAELRNAKGVRILAEVRGVAPGAHGLHLHGVGQCDPPEFTSAGGHFNPAGRKHGFKHPAGPHTGDLPNMQIGPDGKGRLEYVTSLVTLGTGPTSLFDADGTALVLHAAPDDEVTDPSGNSGGRIACGIVRKAS
jgi:Cu-Zn family superoxide dismutase